MTDMRMENDETIQLEIEQPAQTGRSTVSDRFRQLFTFDEVPDVKHHRPIFIVCMSMLHVFIHFTVYIGVLWHGPPFYRAVGNLWMMIVPCMKGTALADRQRSISCSARDEDSSNCSYDDVLRSVCFPFLYPYQLYRIFTVNLVHANHLHLFSNTFKQLLYGIPLERKYGTIRVVSIYWLSEFGASLAGMLAHPDRSE